MRIIPESPQDEAYLEEVLGLRKDGDGAFLVRKNASGLSCWAYAETRTEPTEDATPGGDEGDRTEDDFAERLTSKGMVVCEVCGSKRCVTVGGENECLGYDPYRAPSDAAPDVPGEGDLADMLVNQANGVSVGPSLFLSDKTLFAKAAVEIRRLRTELAAREADAPEPVATKRPIDKNDRFRHEWAIERNVTCVVCPDCGFTFDADHEDVDGSGYSCPLAECRAARPPAVDTALATEAQEPDNDVEWRLKDIASRSSSKDPWLFKSVSDALARIRFLRTRLAQVEAERDERAAQPEGERVEGWVSGGHPRVVYSKSHAMSEGLAEREGYRPCTLTIHATPSSETISSDPRNVVTSETGDSDGGSGE